MGERRCVVPQDLNFRRCQYHSLGRDISSDRLCKAQNKTGSNATQIESQGKIVRLYTREDSISAVVNIARLVVASRQTLSGGVETTSDRSRGESKGKGGIARVQRAKLRFRCVVNIPRFGVTSRQIISESIKSTLYGPRGEPKAKGEFSRSSAQKSELLRASISLAASRHLVSLFLEGCKVRSTGRAANRKPGENSPGPALRNLNCCGRQYRSLHRVILSHCLLRYQKHDQQGARLLGSQEQSLVFSTKISNSAVVNNAQSFVASPHIVSTRLEIRWAAVRRRLYARGELSGSSAQKSKLLRTSISLAASWHLVSLFLDVQKAHSTGRAGYQKPGENSPGPALQNLNCCERQYRSLRRDISSDCLLRYEKHD